MRRSQYFLSTIFADRMRREKEGTFRAIAAACRSKTNLNFSTEESQMLSQIAICLQKLK